MLSVILYGRNDNHGYNLHKRAAISLNAIAHLLSDPADEIVFVDYNTPDDLPTFPEAIADTLTPKAIEKLRVLRVRPSVHQARFAARTHLNALEPIARNVAIRRANPANKWVLSTNTDMIFVPRADGQNLTTAIGALADGFYHLPRFELPEGLWETLDRKDAEGMIAAAKEWGERFHLNEIVVSAGDNLYDGPGDFQLFLREDLYAIGGFHEEMIKGWHLDANVAKRMALLRGKVSSALDRLVGYHCDHTRQATAYHKGDRIENNPVLFVDNIHEPQVRSQMDTWGLPDVDIEELKLGQASGARYLKALETAVQGRLDGFLKADYIPEAFGRLGYEPDHVLPYLLDLVSCIPQDARIGYIGARRDMAGHFIKAWTAMGGAPVQAPDTAPWLPEAGAQAVPMDQWLDRTQVFIFEVGAEQSPDQLSLTDEERARIWAVDQAFKAAVKADRERQAAGAAARRALVINGTHNLFEPQVFASISVTLTPFSSRIRHGYFVDPSRAALQAAGDIERKAAAQLGRTRPLAKAERAQIAELTAALKSGADERTWAAAARLGAEIEALAEAGAKDLFQGVGRPTVELLDRLREARPSRAVKAAAPLISPDAGLGAASRLARIDDWEDADWSGLARWAFESRVHDIMTRRTRWAWERVSLAQNLLSALPSESRPSVLFVGALPDSLPFALAGVGCDVDIANPRSLIEGRLDASDWRDEFKSDGWVSPRPVGLAGERGESFRYDAVVIGQNNLFFGGREQAAALLQTAVRQVRTGGHVGFAAEVQLLDDKAGSKTLAPALLKGGLLGAMEHLVRLPTQGGADMRLTPATLDTLWDSEYPTGGHPALVIGRPPQLESTAVFSLTKGDGADEADWRGLSQVFVSAAYAGPAAQTSAPKPRAASTGLPIKGGRYFTPGDVALLAPRKHRIATAHFGPIFDRLEALNEARLTPMALELRPDLGEELAARADLGVLAPGGYEVVVEAKVDRLMDPGEVFAIGVAGSGRLLAEHAESASAPGVMRVTLAFEVDKETAEAEGGLLVGLKGMGRGVVDLTELVLR